MADIPRRNRPVKAFHGKEVTPKKKNFEIGVDLIEKSYDKSRSTLSTRRPIGNGLRI